MANTVPDSATKQWLAANGQSVEGRTFFVAGCSGQIGSAICSRLAAHGASIIGSSRKKDVLDETERSLEGQWGSWTGGAIIDFTEDDTIESGAAEVKKILGKKPLDGLIIVGGGVGKAIKPSERIDDYPDDELDRVTRLNYLGPVKLVRRMLAVMDAAEEPLLGAVCSMSYELNLSRVQAYECAKMALHQYLQFMVWELAKRENKKWRVHGWQPGFVLAEQNAAVIDEVRRAAILELMPRNRFQTAEDVGTAIVMDCLPCNRDRHGTIVPIAAGCQPGLGLRAV